jgi:hypothetical protein
MGQILLQLGILRRKFILAILTSVVWATHALGQSPAPATSAVLPDAPLPQSSAPIPATSTTVEVTATTQEIGDAQVHLEEKQRILGVFPNFYVSYLPNPVSLTPRQKFHLAFRTLVDPVSLALTGVTAGTQQAANVYAWGQDGPAFAKRYAAAYGTFMNSTLIGSAVLPSLLHQDPRYFVKGRGSIPARAAYAIANAIICKGDNHHWQPNYSAIGGGIAAAGISNLYYPAPNRASARQIFIGASFGTGFSAVSNLIQEFALRKLTPHAPPAELEIGARESRSQDSPK